MNIPAPNLTIPNDDPFKNDVLGRSKIEPPLTQLISRSSHSFVMSIDGALGTGKTTFLEMWSKKLIQEKHICLKFNAWETDFAADPLIVLVKELSEKLKEMSSTFDPKLVDRLLSVTGTIAKRSIPVVVRLLSSGVLDGSGIEKEVSNLTGKLAEDSINAYEESKSAITEFRELLNKLVKENIEQDKNRKIILIIDELDRCRPSYAIELLERVKHLFDIDGVIFILGIDRTQLAESVKALYGSNFDARGYLKRFIDLDYSLPEPENNYCQYLFKHFEVNRLLNENESTRGSVIREEAEKLLGMLFKASNFSLRDQIQTVSRLSIVLKTIPVRQKIYLNGLFILLFLREWNREIYNGLIESSIDSEEILKKLDVILNRLDKRTKEDTSCDYLPSKVEAELMIGIAEINKDDQRQPIPPERFNRYTNESFDRGTRARKTAEYLKILLDHDLSFQNYNPYNLIVGFEISKRYLEILNQFNDN